MSTTTHSHIVPMAHPLFFILRAIQLVLAVVLLGLLAYLAWDYNQIAGTFTTVYSGAVGVGLFTVCLTLILGVYYFVSTLAVHGAYNKWAVVGLEAAAALFWLITFALLADCVSLNTSEEQAAASVTYPYCDNYGNCYYRLGKRGIYDTWNGLWDASLAFAVIEWVLFVATLVLFSLGLHKHRGASSNNTNVATQGYTPKQMEAGPAPAQPVPAPEHAQEQHVPQPTYEQQTMQQHPVQDSTPMH